MSKINLDGLLTNQALFRHISPFELEGLKREVAKLELDKGLSLFQKGDKAEACFILVYGLIKLVIPSSNGSDKIVELIRPGQCFGEAMMFLDESYPFYAEALENSLILRLPKNAIFKLLDQSPSIARQMMTGLSARLLGFIRSVERQSSHNAMQRVVDYLVQVAIAQDRTDIRLELKKNVVASLLNLTPETFSRMLHHLSELGLIRVSASRIQITSLRALQDYPNGHVESPQKEKSEIDLSMMKQAISAVQLQGSNAC
ncbi:Crp/Fnr family transcriptional regulator [Undibacterium fentianense]|uniref:Crp/Fnr family transcriptional regulator n=1 Tax=Undibacterium fentianense TaxID=2828728 RepID=A0A941E538_9BURK|nr:Crp/Fnr family transcriptional regulator [Undibacterium fentianense]MBR7801222.1 Crp/Fnr family transcriptional regulator [Undibacterium fentianense]